VYCDGLLRECGHIAIRGGFNCRARNELITSVADLRLKILHGVRPHHPPTRARAETTAFVIVPQAYVMLLALGASSPPAGSAVSASRGAPIGVSHHTGLRHDQRILFFFATHGSEEHAHYLRCWSLLLPQLPESLASSDVLVYIGAELNEDEVHRWNATVDLFRTGGRDVRTEYGEAHTLQAGAMLPMHLALTHGWLRVYDWVIRLNPDVFVHNGSHLDSALRSNKWWAVLARCSVDLGPGRCNVHTDIYAFRPGEMDKLSHAAWNSTRRYEVLACRSVFKHAIEQSRVAWLTGNTVNACRMSGAGGLVHHHSLSHREKALDCAQTCPLALGCPPSVDQERRGVHASVQPTSPTSSGV
jgi:hypothetical protein